MSSLEEDILRIAALRGRHDTAALVEQAQAPEPISWAELQRCTSTEGIEPDRDLAFSDALPERLRRFFRDAERPLNAMWCYNLWHRVRDEDLVIQAITAAIRRRP